MSKFQIVKGITDNLEDTPYVEGKVYFTYEDTKSEDISIYADIDGVRRKIKEGVQEEELNNYLLKTDIAAWAKESTKPTYTAAEVGATTTSEVNSAIATAIGNINQFNVAIVSTLPTENIDTHTIYFMSNGGSGDSVYDEWMYINNNWEKIGTTAVDLSGYMQTSHPANGITSTDITNWNAKISDTGKWNEVALGSGRFDTLNDLWIPSKQNSDNNSGTAYWVKTTQELPTESAAESVQIPRYKKINNQWYLQSTTPSANDNSTKVATTAYVDAAIPKVYSSTNTTGYLTMDTLPIYDGTVV